MQRIVELLRWIRLNGAFMLTGFVLTGGLIALAPQTMLGVFAGLARFYEALGARGAGSFVSDAEVFSHILQRNAIAAAAFFVVGMVLQGPLAAILGGAFYGLVAFLAPRTIGRAFGPNDWLLVAVEALALVLSVSLGSAIAGELYDVAGSLRAWSRYFRGSWRSLSMKLARPARPVLASWVGVFGAVVVIIAGMLLFVAWFETRGY